MTLRVGTEFPKEHSLSLLRGFVWFNLTHCHCPGEAAMSWWKCATKRRPPRAQGHGGPTEKEHCGSHGSDRLDSWDLSLLLSASRGRSQPLLQELSCSSSSLPPGTPPYTCLGSLQPPPNSFTRGLGEMFHAGAETQADAAWFCFSDRTTWQKSQHQWMYEPPPQKWQLLEALRSLAVLTHLEAHGYVAVPFSTTESSMATVLYSSNNRQHREKTNPGLVDRLPDTAFPCFRTL